MTTTRSFRPRANVVVLFAALVLTQLRGARAENSATFKYQDYAELGGRMNIKVMSALIEQDLRSDLHLKLQGVTDAIAGATPSGELPATPGADVPLSEMHDHRKAWNAELAQQFSRINVALGASESREHDYVSDGASVNTLTDFNEKNTTLLLGLAGNNDRVKVFYQGPYVSKTARDAIIGVTQLLSPLTVVSLDFSYNRTKGYLNDPYRLIQKSTQIVPGVFLPLTYPENRPDQRSNWTVFAGLNHAVPAAAGAVEANYRLYHDTFGTTAHTLELKWLQKIGQQLVLTPLVRYYQQTAANFYRVSLDGTSIVPGFLPKPTGPFYSADYRLAKLRTWGYGMEAVWNTPLNWLRVDVAWEQYDMQGRDGFTPSSFYPRANITTFGVKISW